MGATNTTPNIGLPSFVGTDKPAWLTDWNGAMSTIDTEIGTLKTDVSGDGTQISGLSASVTALNNTVGQHTTSIQTLTNSTTHNAGDIATINSLIGNGTPTTTDQTIIGAINELHADQGDLTNLTTTDKSSIVAAVNELAGGGSGSIIASAVSYSNTSSGLTANNVQSAIDELAAGSVVDFDLTAHTGSATLTAASGATLSFGEVNYAINADYTVGKIYGGMYVNGTFNSTDQLAGTITIPGMPHPTSSYDVFIGVVSGYTQNTGYKVKMRFNTDGTISLLVTAGSTSYTSNQFPINLAPCIYFLQDFGD